MDADCGVELRVGLSHERRHRPTSRHAGHVHSAIGDVVLVDDLARDTGDKRRLAPPALLVRSLKPVPALVYVGALGLRGIGYEEDVFLGEHVHLGPGGDVVGILGTAVEHHDQGHFLSYVATWDVQLVRTGSGLIGVRALDEASPRRNNRRISPPYFQAGHIAGYARRSEARRV